ncbi:MAG: GNAT family N-acetyltransferase [Ardenticatenaceae bacterium]|nr:GNAT family N-acetyltransferase [Ardenticatenaceae bacterium]
MNEVELLIRQATREDVREVVRLLVDDVLGSQREQYGADLPQGYYGAFEQINRDENNELIVVERAGEIVGTLQLTFLPGMSYGGSWRGQIEAVRVDGRYRNQRIGQKLVEWAVERARQRGCYLVQLTTNKGRLDAHRFYERLGFVASHEGMKLSL